MPAAERERADALTNGIMQQPRASFLHTRQPARQRRGKHQRALWERERRSFPRKRRPRWMDRFSQIPHANLKVVLQILGAASDKSYSLRGLRKQTPGSASVQA